MCGAHSIALTLGIPRTTNSSSSRIILLPVRPRYGPDLGKLNAVTPGVRYATQKSGDFSTSQFLCPMSPPRDRAPVSPLLGGRGGDRAATETVLLVLLNLFKLLFYPF